MAFRDGRLRHVPSPVRPDPQHGNFQAGESSIEVYECPNFSLTFESGNGALPRELRTDFEKAVAYWSGERRKDWRVSTYLEDDQHLAYAAIRTTGDPTFRDPRPLHLSFGFAAGDKPFAIHIRFQRPRISSPSSASSSPSSSRRYSPGGTRFCAFPDFAWSNFR
ncbi:MAG: hypothetical protein WDN28_31865 [Chthoniobacter sp.]